MNVSPQFIDSGTTPFIGDWHTVQSLPPLTAYYLQESDVKNIQVTDFFRIRNQMDDYLIFDLGGGLFRLVHHLTDKLKAFVTFEGYKLEPVQIEDIRKQESSWKDSSFPFIDVANCGLVPFYTHAEYFRVGGPFVKQLHLKQPETVTIKSEPHKKDGQKFVEYDMHEYPGTLYGPLQPVYAIGTQVLVTDTQKEWTFILGVAE